MTNKQFYKRHFATAQDFKNWVIKLQTAYAMSFSPVADSYELEKLHKAFGTCDPEKLVNIIYGDPTENQIFDSLKKQTTYKKD